MPSLEKAEVIRGTLLHREGDFADIPENISVHSEREIVWPEVILDEALRAACKVRTTTSGIDKILAKVLVDSRLAYHHAVSAISGRIPALDVQ